ncbi:MAG TPA: FAD-dependent monooxygenase [Polyangiaceae bacterium]|nr:FAD-dependent monooxygenase [Polyangiaceae bacterium]
MSQEHFDAIVVGAGPAGSAAAYTMAKAGLKVLQLERGEYPGAKNVQGAILYSEPLEKLMPDFREDAPLERHIIEQRLWMLDDTSYVGMHYRSEDFNEERPNRYTIIRTQFDKWFARKVRDAGALLLCETTVTELVRDEQGRVIGVRTDRDGEPVLADVVVLGEGVNGLLGQRAGLRRELKADTVALAVKEMHFLPQEVVDARFNLKGSEGVVVEAMGTVTGGMVGTGFIYTNKESLSIGIGCLVSDFVETGETPAALLERFKTHPAIKPLLEGSECKEYSGHLIPEGGYHAVPELYGDGWVVVGDAGHFVNGVHREGSNLAITTGRLAGETIAELKHAGRAMTRKNLAGFKQRLDRSFVMKDLRKYKDLPGFMHKNRHMFGLYPRLLSQATQTWFRVDGVDKLSKEKEIVSSFRKSRSIGGLLGDAFKMMRVWR